MQQNTEKQTCKCSHLQFSHSEGDVHWHSIHTSPPLSLLQSHCLSVCCGPLFPLPREWGGGGGCVPCSRHLPIPPLACATLHLQGIKSEPPESTEKKDKKIGHNENQKHRLSLSLSLSPPPLSPSSAMNLERRERRRIKLNSNQLSAAPDDRALKCKCACVSFSLSYSLSPLPLSATFFFFLWTEGESLEALQFNRLLTCFDERCSL